MKATEAKPPQILGAVSRFIIPIDQRTTSWTLKECQQLWADILRAGSTQEIGVAHLCIASCPEGDETGRTC